MLKSLKVHTYIIAEGAISFLHFFRSLDDQIGLRVETCQSTFSS